LESKASALGRIGVQSFSFRDGSKAKALDSIYIGHSSYKENIMQALREIYEVTSDTITINIPKTFPYQKVEVIVLQMEENLP
jgi:hypothetical protein